MKIFQDSYRKIYLKYLQHPFQHPSYNPLQYLDLNIDLELQPQFHLPLYQGPRRTHEPLPDNNILTDYLLNEREKRTKEIIIEKIT